MNKINETKKNSINSNSEESNCIAAYILAGGQSSRMGTDKALLEINGIPLLVRVARLLEVVARSVTIVGHLDRHSGFGYDVISDRKDRVGAPYLDYFTGIVTALEHSNAKWTLIIPVDKPYMTAEWLYHFVNYRHTVDVDLICGRFPLLYQEGCVDRIIKALEKSEVLSGNFYHSMKYLSYFIVPKHVQRQFDPNGNLFLDVDTPEEFERARNLLSQSEE